MKHHIAVVGAGFAGMAAAYELNSLGVKVTVLEARERVSGRVWSKQLTNGATVELGAEWIGPADHSVREIVKRLDLPLANVGVDFLVREPIQGESIPTEVQHDTIRVAAETIESMDRSFVDQGTVTDLIDALPVSQDRRTLFAARLRSSFGSDLSKIALRMMTDRDSPLRTYVDGAKGNELYDRVVGGNHTIATTIAALLAADDSADVRLKHSVSLITHDETGVTVKGQADGAPFEVKADGVIVAVPVKLAAELEFDPALPADHADAIARVSMGMAAKIAVGTKEAPSIRALQDVEKPYWCWTGKGGDGTVRKAITAFCGSTHAQEHLATTSYDPTTWLNELQTVNPDLEFVDEPIMVDWSQDDLALGCYSAFDNHAADTIPLLSKPEGRLFFAGEHTDKHSGTMNGALSSGLRAAKEVMDVVTH
jgi:monoamine oxidase